MADEAFRKDRDMILAPNEFIFVRDDTKGNVDVFVGPTKQSLGGQDQPVVFDPGSKRFVERDYAAAKQLRTTAPEGWYVVLKNPAEDGKQPQGAGKLSSARLEVGKKVVLAGPVTFSLWPGQMAKVLQGHHLRSNQYLLARVYDEAAARESWHAAVVKTVDGSGEPEAVPAPGAKLTMGQLIVIRGTEVSFFIPPTGLEVVADAVEDEDGEVEERLVREAVTLERLEYCVLKDEDGNKRYERGPAVVFPKPTEAFVEDESGARKFRAIELNENSGIYVKVIADYEEGDKGSPGGVKLHHVGDELFITGKQQMIYFPRPEHALVKYGESELHFGIAIPAGEARYVLDRNTGTVELVRGPRVYLPDPRTHVIVRRVLDPKLCDLLYPGNAEALEYNLSLAGREMPLAQAVGGRVNPGAGSLSQATGGVFANAGMLDAFSGQALYASSNVMRAAPLVPASAEAKGLTAKAGRKHAGDSIDRRGSYTEPRTITLSGKYAGAVGIGVYTGYAVQLVRASGQRRVVVGPQKVLLEYDEVPEVLELSTGKPKTTDKLLRTAYLRVTANKVADVIRVETSDHCNVDVKVSYCVDFAGSSEKWFSVENYVKFLCDRARSLLKAAVRRLSIEEFYATSTDVVQSVLLGEAPMDANGEFEARTGLPFAENGMVLYDVEVLGVTLADPEVARVVAGSQIEAVKLALEASSSEAKLGVQRRAAAVQQELAEIQAGSQLAGHQRMLRTIESEELVRRRQEAAQKRQLEAEKASKIFALQQDGEAAAIDRKRVEEDAILQQAIAENLQARQLLLLQAEVQAVVDKAKAVSPDLIAALDTFGERQVVERVAQSMAPLAILGGTSVSDVVQKLFAGTPLARHLTAALATSNGRAGTAASAAD